MKAKRIKPIAYPRNKTAVWANTHGGWVYTKNDGNLAMQIKEFSEEQECLATHDVVLSKEITDTWGADDEVMILAAFAAKGIEIDTEFVEPIEEQPNVEGL